MQNFANLISTFLVQVVIIFKICNWAHIGSYGVFRIPKSRKMGFLRKYLGGVALVT